MSQSFDLERFIEAQNKNYEAAINEIYNGKKVTHWMWYVFPQLKDLGKTETAKFFGISSIEEAKAYLKHPVLGKRLLAISEVLLKHQNKSANEIFGKPDDLKLKSCMTLFLQTENAPVIFEKVLDTFYNGEKDVRTLEILQ
ncbi:DUF1810 family protein [Flavobacterium sp. NST-5]|uniref:DUF1810 family protein n=1 Tax=Flavobacterium ichthyis TaxID=2698827 RepID=A0ABW9Z405_9FLAO|nr:DUF1810 domain-containing protein [Flavobacterium ichthyis]NBL63591.1 DUF1810 family protein [Flavobacterium ichthyis]